MLPCDHDQLPASPKRRPARSCSSDLRAARLWISSDRMRYSASRPTSHPAGPRPLIDWFYSPIARALFAPRRASA